jgi:hypothetical protein
MPWSPCCLQPEFSYRHHGLSRGGRRAVENSSLLIIEEQIGPIPPNYLLPQMKPKRLEREVRRARHLSAWIKVEDRADCEYQVLDISQHGAKVIVASAVPDHFELAFFRRWAASDLRSHLAARQDARRQVHVLNDATNNDHRITPNLGQTIQFRRVANIAQISF